MTFTWRRGAAYLLIRYERTVREALRNPIQVLSSLTEKSKNESYRFQRLYRNLYNPEFYWLAYKNIYANTGSMTAGADGTTIDGMSDERIQRIIESMRDKSYLPKPARREYIAKKNSNKKRPLGIQSGNDKLVQEVVKMILESIYEPVFKKTSHGFRPNKSCQTALYQIQKTFTGTNWFVEGDIHACFDSFNHHTIIRLLRKRIDDEMFLQLIWKFLKAGYMEQWTYNRTYSGVPQGSGVSPVLANVYLHELDKFMEEYAQKYNRGKKKQMNSDYKKVVKKASYYRCMGKKKWADLSPEERWERNKHLKMLEKQTRQLDAAMDIGSYQGFNMRIQFDSWSKEFILSVKHESVAKVRLGADALGNITRINNLLESYPEKLAEAEQRLETVQEQLANAKAEVGKPFPKEEELNQKLERLSELNALLNMDEREDTEAEQPESKEKEERPAHGSIHEKLQIYKEKSQRERETGRETRKRDFGLE